MVAVARTGGVICVLAFLFPSSPNVCFMLIWKVSDSIPGPGARGQVWASPGKFSSPARNMNK